MNIETHMKREYNKKEIMKIFNIPKDERVIYIRADRWSKQKELEVGTEKR